MTESTQECIHPGGDARHRAQDDPAAGGEVVLDQPGGELLRALRLGQLLAIIGAPADSRTPLSVLDAGCGGGWFARALARDGHRVDAFDTSSAAVAQARGEGGGPRHVVADLSGRRSPRPYDVVLCLDVLFHVLDDDAWAAALRTLASLVRPSGRLIVTDADPGERAVRGDRLVYRPATAYRAALEPLGLRHRHFLPHGFRENTVGFHVFTRIRRHP
ncbi:MULTISPECIES: methyltransferase domain-containing protein [unclassified Streptomyces]|uniref:class I SAM-dependent methyltransferase n=1 Tax=unclassified Streptomyces TaxID=2593676 RepID=UPI0033B3BF23